MRRSLALAALAALFLSVCAVVQAEAADEPLLQLEQQPLASNADQPLLPVKQQLQASKQPVKFVRSESLEMPGLTACHQCEWRPKPNQMRAADRCGLGTDGQPKVAEFECGFSEDCQRVCNFVRCLGQ